MEAPSTFKSGRPPAHPSGDTNAPYTQQHRRPADTKVQWHGSPGGPALPKKPPSATGAIGRTPSGRSVCVFSKGDRVACMRARAGEMEVLGFWGAVGSFAAGLLTGLMYDPVDPHGAAKRGAAITAAAVGPLLPAVVKPLAWHWTDRSERRSRLTAERAEILDMSPLDRLDRHVDLCNAVGETHVHRKGPLVPEKLEEAIAFIHQLQAETAGADEPVSDDDVANAIAELAEVAVDVMDEDSFGSLTAALTQMAVSGRCKPEEVLDLLKIVVATTRRRVNAIYGRVDLALAALEAQNEARLRVLGQREHQLAAAIVKTLAPLQAELPQDMQVTVSRAWAALANRQGSLDDVVQFAELVARIDPATGQLATDDDIEHVERLVARLAVAGAPVHDERVPYTAMGGVRLALSDRPQVAAAARVPLPLEPGPAPLGQPEGGRVPDGLDEV